MKKKIIIWRKIVLFFAGICFLYFYLSPLFKPSERIGSLPGDTYYYAYETKWFCENYFKLDLVNKDLYAPIGVDMSLGYHMPTLLALGCVFYAKGPIAMFNFIEAFQVCLIFFSSYLVSRRFLKNIYIKIIFIALYSFSTFYLARIYGHTDVLSTIWATSLCFYFFYKIDLNNRNKVIVSFLIATLSFTSCWQNIPNLIILIGILLLNSFWNDKKNLKVKTKNLLIASLVSLSIFLIFSYPMLLSFVGQKQTKDYASNYIYNADALSYLVPLKGILFENYIKILRNKITVSRFGTFFELYNSIDIFILIIFIFFLFDKNKSRIPKKLLILLTCIYYLLSFGPKLTVGGHEVTNLPIYEFLMKIPPFSITRTPARIGIVVTFLVTLTSLNYLDIKIAKNKSKIIKFLLILFTLYSILTTTYFANNTKFISHNYITELPNKGLNYIETDKQENYVLNIPLATGGDDASQNFLQLFHKKKIITGLVSYAAQTDETYLNIKNDPILSYLGCRNDRFQFIHNSKNDGKDENIKNILYDDYLLSKRLLEKSIKFVIVNKGLLRYEYCDNLRDYVGYLTHDSGALELIDETALYSVFRVNNIKLDNNNSRLVLTGPWSKPWGVDNNRWIIGLEAGINILTPSKKTVHLYANTFHFNDSFEKTIIVKLREVEHEIKLTSKNIDIKINLVPGENLITFILDSCEKPKDFSINGDTNCYGVGLSNLRVKEEN